MALQSGTSLCLVNPRGHSHLLRKCRGMDISRLQRTAYDAACELQRINPDWIEIRDRTAGVPDFLMADRCLSCVVFIPAETRAAVRHRPIVH
jgi:hypothetical protein